MGVHPPLVFRPAVQLRAARWAALFLPLFQELFNRGSNQHAHRLARFPGNRL